MILAQIFPQKQLCVFGHLKSEDDSTLWTAIKLRLFVFVSLRMNQRSLLSPGQWRRAVPLTPVSLVQTKHSSGGDTLFLPGGLCNRTPDSSPSRRTQGGSADRGEGEDGHSVHPQPLWGSNTHTWAYKLLLCACVCTEFRSLTLHSRLCINIPVMFHCGDRSLPPSCKAKYLLDAPVTCKLSFFWLKEPSCD